MELHGYGYDRCFDCLFHPYNGQGRSRAIYKPWIYVFKGEQVKVKWKDMLLVDVLHIISHPTVLIAFVLAAVLT